MFTAQIPDTQALEALRLVYLFAYSAPFVLVGLGLLLWWARPRRSA